jgi:hypothetical protein
LNNQGYDYRFYFRGHTEIAGKNASYQGTDDIYFAEEPVQFRVGCPQKC